MLFGLLALIQLPRLNHPLFASRQFHRATDDGFFIAIEARDPKFSPNKTRDLLAEIGGDQHRTRRRGRLMGRCKSQISNLKFQISRCATFS